MKITLSEADAKRLNCPRVLIFDEEGLTGRDLMELEEQVGWSADSLERAFQGIPAVNALGGPIYEMDGDKPKLDGMGKPIRVMTLTTKTLMVVVWLCVRRANPEIDWKSFDFHVGATEIDNAEEPVGKAPSPKSTTTTKPRSRRSTASPRGTSARS